MPFWLTCASDFSARGAAVNHLANGLPVIVGRSDMFAGGKWRSNCGGENLQYLVYECQQRPLACLRLGAAASRCARCGPWEYALNCYPE